MQIYRFCFEKQESVIKSPDTAYLVERMHVLSGMVTRIVHSLISFGMPRLTRLLKLYMCT